jgi:ADP-heptose:LPS heptosyltransferase
MNAAANPWHVLWGKFHWHANDFLTRRPGLLNFFGAALSVEDMFGSPGDTLTTATFCREIKKRYPRLKINCITPNPSLLTHDPDIDTLNGPKGFLNIPFWYWYSELNPEKGRIINLLDPMMRRLGITGWRYRARVYLTGEEIAWAKRQVAELPRPIISINAMSREMVKVWPVENWRILTGQLTRMATVVQLGDAKEPELEGVVRWAGKLSLRESMAILSQINLHIGPDSFLMHAANGVDVPAVVIYGGSRSPACSGYPENTNLYVDIECSPCWLHDSRGDKCPFAIKCMGMITPEMVFAAVKELLARAPNGNLKQEV